MITRDQGLRIRAYLLVGHEKAHLPQDSALDELRAAMMHHELGCVPEYVVLDYLKSRMAPDDYAALRQQCDGFVGVISRQRRNGRRAGKGLATFYDWTGARLRAERERSGSTEMGKHERALTQGSACTAHGRARRIPPPPRPMAPGSVEDSQ